MIPQPSLPAIWENLHQRLWNYLRAMLLECCHFEFDRYGRVIDYWRHCCCCLRNAAG